MYPKRCPFCQGISSKGICDDCRKQVVKVGKIKCIHCGKPLEDETKEYCRDCERRKSNYEQGRSLWVHIPPVSNSVYRLKYHNKRYYAEIFGKELADEFEFQIRRWGIQAIIPIPLHRSKMRKRGYNQAELLAKQLSECMGIPMEKDVLYRIKKTRPLKEMNGEQRHRIRLMTKMSIYEKNHKDDFKIADYYRKDYASLKTWITLIWVTIGYAILFVSFCIYSSDSLSADLTIFKLFVLLIAAIAGYIVLLVIYGVCANSFYKRKHAVAKQNVKRYYRNLSRLEKMCKKEKNEQ